LQFSEATAEKASRLVDEHRVFLVSDFTAFVGGDSGQWKVTATINGVYCSCPARVKCSHALAAQAAWAEVEQR
jgi:hypothetical protein